ncbi:MAG: hypothetical protein SFT91_03705 [Rickettsiaceae bacterium]|nr:hypothetical protein [Rickettsiaceae bacterium]
MSKSTKHNTKSSASKLTNPSLSPNYKYTYLDMEALSNHHRIAHLHDEKTIKWIAPISKFDFTQTPMSRDPIDPANQLINNLDRLDKSHLRKVGFCYQTGESDSEWVFVLLKRSGGMIQMKIFDSRRFESPEQEQTLKVQITREIGLFLKKSIPDAHIVSSDPKILVYKQHGEHGSGPITIENGRRALYKDEWDAQIDHQPSVINDLSSLRSYHASIEPILKKSYTSTDVENNIKIHIANNISSCLLIGMNDIEIFNLLESDNADAVLNALKKLDFETYPVLFKYMKTIQVECAKFHYTTIPLDDGDVIHHTKDLLVSKRIQERSNKKFADILEWAKSIRAKTLETKTKSHPQDKALIATQEKADNSGDACKKTDAKLDNLPQISKESELLPLTEEISKNAPTISAPVEIRAVSVTKTLLLSRDITQNNSGSLEPEAPTKGAIEKKSFILTPPTKNEARDNPQIPKEVPGTSDVKNQSSLKESALSPKHSEDIAASVFIDNLAANIISSYDKLLFSKICFVLEEISKEPDLATEIIDHAFKDSEVSNNLIVQEFIGAINNGGFNDIVVALARVSLEEHLVVETNIDEDEGYEIIDIQQPEFIKHDDQGVVQQAIFQGMFEDQPI